MSNYVVGGVDLESLNACEIPLFLDNISSDEELLEQVRKLPLEGALYEDDKIIEMIEFLRGNYGEESPEIKILSKLENLGPYLCMRMFGIGATDRVFEIDDIVYSTKIFISENYVGFDELNDITVGKINSLLIAKCKYLAQNYANALIKKEFNKLTLQEKIFKASKCNCENYNHEWGHPCYKCNSCKETSDYLEKIYSFSDDIRVRVAIVSNDLFPIDKFEKSLLEEDHYVLLQAMTFNYNISRETVSKLCEHKCEDVKARAGFIFATGQSYRNWTCGYDELSVPDEIKIYDKNDYENYNYFYLSEIYNINVDIVSPHGFPK